jgi:hypothetical protein
MQRCHVSYYPQYTIQQGDQETRKPLHAAAQAIAEGATLLSTIHESDGSTHPISPTEQQQVMEAVEAWQQS